MPHQDELPPKKFRPERPIYLHESNTGYKTQIEVLHAVERLRGEQWLCAYSENIKPFHLSFNNESEFQEFKKCCQELDVKLKAPILKPDEDYSKDETVIVQPEPLATSESPEGVIEVQTPAHITPDYPEHKSKSKKHS